MSERHKNRMRKLSVIAATVMSFACGTNYVFSAWAPSFAAKLRLSNTDINLLGAFGNLGMYAAGIPIGLIVDAKGPKPGSIIGAILLGAGYFSLHRAFVEGPGSVSVPLLCFFSFLTGLGGCFAFAGAVKTSALNWPTHRGTATAFPLAAFGLSAFLFAVISIVSFPDNTDDFLLMLSAGTFGMVLISSFFLRIIPHSTAYAPISTEQPTARRASNALYTASSSRGRHTASFGNPESGTQPEAVDSSSSYHNFTSSDPISSDGADPLPSKSLDAPKLDLDDASSISSSNVIAEDFEEDVIKADSTAHEHVHIDIRGLALLKNTEFYQQFLLMGTLTGVGLMSINNIGNDAQALWSHWDDSVPPGWIQRRQLTHVMIISACSFLGRLLSGIGSDLIVRKLHMSRSWCLLISSILFGAAQVCGLRIENPNWLVVLSALTGLAYGFLFGVFPSIVAEAFGVHGLSQNWGCMTIAPVIFGQIFNVVYGKVYDAHSFVDRDGNRNCPDGRWCYNIAYWVTLVSSALGFGVGLWSIWHHRRNQIRARKKEEEESRES